MESTKIAQFSPDDLDNLFGPGAVPAPPRRVVAPFNTPSLITPLRTEPKGWRMADWPDFDNLEDPSWLIDGWLPQQSIGCLYGEPGSGKTFAAIDMAICIAAGIPWHGHAVKQAAVLYVDGESQRGLKVRAFARASAYGLKSVPYFHWIHGGPPILSDPAQTERIIEVCESIDQPMGLIVFDTLAMTFLGVENDAADMNNYVRNAKRLCDRLRCTALTLHHTGASGLRERGSTALRGAADVMIPVRKRDLTVTLAGKQTKMKEAEPPKPMIFLMTPHLNSLVLVDDPNARPLANVTGKTAEIQQAIKNAGPGGIGWGGLEGLGFSKSTLNRGIRELTENRLIVKRDDGTYAVSEQSPGEPVDMLDTISDFSEGETDGFVGDTNEDIYLPTGGNVDAADCDGDEEADEEDIFSD